MDWFASSRAHRLAMGTLTLLALCLASAHGGALPSATPRRVASPTQDLEKDLRAKDPAVREAAVRRVATEGGERAEKRLLTALKDQDWSVLIAALDGLAAHGKKDALRPLLDMAQEGPFQQARTRAAVALATALPEAASSALYDALRGKSVAAALPALAAAGAAGARPSELTRLERLLEHEEPPIRTAAARAWVACLQPAERANALTDFFTKRDLAQQAAGLEILATIADERDLVPLTALLATPALAPALERRALAATRAALLAVTEDAARAQRFETSVASRLRASSAGRTQLARLLTLGGTPALVPVETARTALMPLLGDAEADVRAAAGHALSIVGGESTPLLVPLEAEADTRVRATLVRAAASLNAAATPEGAASLRARLRSDSSTAVREAAAIGLGRSDASGDTIEALIAAAQERDWEVAMAATIALGKTRSDRGRTALIELTRHVDWKLRGAAAMGLYYVAQPEVVAPLIALLDDPHTAVSATAQRALAIHAGREAEALDRRGLLAWWKENLERARFQTPEEVRARRDRYGYAVPDREVYRGLDVMVVPGRGDQMETVLARIGIEHRVVQAGQLGAAGLHPFGILIAGCTGELEARDIDVVRWYVRAGGALFTSCWALTYTVEASFPGIVTKFPAPDEVLDRVRATPVALGSPYLNGVFDGGVVPIYELQGAHLIQVLDPERVQVLVDSPEAAMRHGSGVLAAWFRVGHGVVLDSVNHFDLQGLELATHLKQPEELMGYAVDHMGLTLERLREVRGAAWWKSRAKAAREVDDLSAFRILTNFVREKRMNGS